MNRRSAVLVLLTALFWVVGPASASAQVMNDATQRMARLIPKKGLLLSAKNIEIATGSEINFFTSDRTKHEYFFTWWEQDADSTVAGQDILYIGSHNTAISGTAKLLEQGNIAYLTIDCKRNDTKTGQADLTYTKLWLPYFTEARWQDSRGAIESEKLNAFFDTVLYVFSPVGNYRFSNSQPFRVKKDEDPNPAPNNYTRRAQHLLLYESQIPVTGSTPLKRKFVIEHIGPYPERSDISEAGRASLEITPKNKRIKSWIPPATPTPFLLPRPIQETYEQNFYDLPLSNSTTTITEATEKTFSHYGPHRQSLLDSSLKLYRELLQHAWLSVPAIHPSILLRQDSTLRAEHYRLRVNSEGILIDFADAPAWQYAIYSLAQLTQNKAGKLAIPFCQIEDGPALSFRGIHMFTGPTAWSFHKRMYDKVLLPLKMNKTVIQCEQAAWTSFPSIHNSISAPLEDLQKEFTYLREKQVEPIPLIQSLGHMEWFFKPISTRQWAVNPQYPYTLDARKPAARKAILTIWEEAFSLLKPTTLHVGFDEIGMIGFQLPKEKEIALFKKQLGVLDRFARTKKAGLMIWGDMGLAPGEAPDACNGITPKRARTIRNQIPPGTWIADWHYIGDPDPTLYKSSLQLWKQAGFKPLASPWLLPNNVRGFTLAAIDQQAGLLQTTWADFESSERNMLLNIEQFGAYVLALDYAWSGRKELPADLPYDPVQRWAENFYRQPQPIETRVGRTLDTTIALQNRCTAIGQQRPSEISIRIKSGDSIIGIQLTSVTETLLPESTPVAILRGYMQEKLVVERIIRYGAEVRAIQDNRICYAYTRGQEEKAWHLFFDRPLALDKVTFNSLHPGAGFTIKNLTLIE